MQTISGLAEGQVLQRVGSRGANLELSGVTAREGSVQVFISNAKGSLKGWKGVAAGKASKGRFKVRLQGIPAGGPYRLELRVDGAKIGVVRSFFVGDVWLMAGQSNMEGCGNLDGAPKPHPLIRSFSLRREWRLATDPLHVLPESPDSCHFRDRDGQCTPEEGEELRRKAVRGCGVGIFFAKEMMERSGVPQGLICAAHGGTSMAQWNPERKSEGGASLYWSMLETVRATGQPVAGMLWYQGESDANGTDAPLYPERMKQLVAATRRDLMQSDLPWIAVQISRVYPVRVSRDDVVSWNRIQEEQRLLPDRIRGLETVSAVDLPLDDGIHIGTAGYPRLAARMARAADRFVYGSRREKRPPQLKSISPLKYARNFGFSVELHFENVEGGLQAAGEANGFAILDKAGNDLCAIYKTTLHGDTVRLHLVLPARDGLLLAYGHATMPVCNVTDRRGEGLLAFGPIPLEKHTALLPLVSTWKVTDVFTSPVSLDKITAREAAAHDGTVKTFENGFVNEHPLWEGHSGLACFSSRIRLSEPMKLDVLMGYDGPFRLWIGGKPFFEDMNGTNPAIMDEKSKRIVLPAGTHDLRIAMDTNGGRAYGFFLRFRRTDVSAAQIKSGDYAKPAYLV